MAETSFCCQVVSPNNLSHAMSFCHPWLTQVRACRMNHFFRGRYFLSYYAQVLRMTLNGRNDFVATDTILLADCRQVRFQSTSNIL